MKMKIEVSSAERTLIAAALMGYHDDKDCQDLAVRIAEYDAASDGSEVAILSQRRKS